MVFSVLSVSIFYDLLPFLCKTYRIKPVITQYKKGNYPRKSFLGFRYLLIVHPQKQCLPQSEISIYEHYKWVSLVTLVEALQDIKDMCHTENKWKSEWVHL